MAELDNYKVRYIVEHRAIPEIFYREKAGLLNAILDKQGQFFSQLFDLVSQTAEDEEAMSYSEEDFNIEPRGFRCEDMNVYVIIVDMPKPQCSPLCRTLYFCYEETTETVKYYTSEKSIETPYMLCGWNDDQTHVNYGRAELDREKEFMQTARLFIDLISKAN